MDYMWNVWHCRLLAPFRVVFIPFTPWTHTLSYTQKAGAPNMRPGTGHRMWSDRNSCYLPCSAHQSQFVDDCSAQAVYSNHIATPATSSTFKIWTHSQRMAAFQVVKLHASLNSSVWLVFCPWALSLTRCCDLPVMSRSIEYYIIILCNCWLFTVCDLLDY